LGINCKLKLLTKFQYQARYKNIGSENEICALLIGKYNGKIKSNPKEVADWKWIDIKDLKKDLKKNPGKYAPWLKIALKYYEKCK
jgi:isopentenyl-diphosphate delta-isomerase